MKIGIIIAMEEEAIYLINKLDLQKKEHKYFDLYENKNIYLIVCGIGLTCASVAASYLAFKLECERLYNIGTCGCTGNGFSSNEIVSISKVYKRDFNLESIGYKKYEVPTVGQYINAITDNNFKISPCYSADEFVTKDSVVPDDVIVEMEAYSIAYVANLAKIPCHIYKIVTDFTKNNHDQSEHLKNLDIASTKLANILIHLF